MRRPSLFTALGVLVVSGMASAAPAKAPEAWASGSLDRFDPSTQSVVVKQGTHEMTFVLAADAHLTQGKKSVTPAELGSEVGHTVKVRYTTSGTQRIADRVEVADATPAPTKTAAKK
jgi:hypothetical protein